MTGRWSFHRTSAPHISTLRAAIPLKMRLRVESVLASFEEETLAGKLVGSAAAETMQASVPGIGGHLGPYKITSVLGRGGIWNNCG